LAERASLSAHGIQNLERGVSRPYRATLQRLLGALQLSSDEQAGLRTAAGTPPRSGRLVPDAEAARHNFPIQRPVANMGGSKW